MIDWYIEGLEFGNCNCDWGCPCQFEALPNEGHCRGFEALQINKGHYGDVELDGLRVVMLYAWPGPIFEGNGTLQAIIDERADAQQRHALQTVLYGGETEEAATHWWVFHAMSSHIHEPLFKAIELEIDIDARRANVSVEGVITSVGQPIVSPATGDEHRVRIDIPNGIEFELAEIGSASTKATGAIKLDLNNSYGQFNVLRHSGSGVVH
ncbi:DUF1326 domain-containing protein [Limibacillus halophilus]|uniref:DUF1326 domain-containing protein n=1 Tax=Limibacillus halophilus TaxID=1579333 RepID=A0A839SSC5_9PROT|nr:DUF1326 domain-containing protein [Limibacillus halophilus]MBB3065218.1 hypothetical protein [Limibacillus halophilus]